mgnify:FL=1
MKNTIYVEGIKRHLIGESGVTPIVARLTSKYKLLPQQLIRIGDDEIVIVCKSNLSESMYDLESIANEINNMLLLSK